MTKRLKLRVRCYCLVCFRSCCAHHLQNTNAWMLISKPQPPGCIMSNQIVCIQINDSERFFVTRCSNWKSLWWLTMKWTKRSWKLLHLHTSHADCHRVWSWLVGLHCFPMNFLNSKQIANWNLKLLHKKWKSQSWSRLRWGLKDRGKAGNENQRTNELFAFEQFKGAIFRYDISSVIYSLTYLAHFYGVSYAQLKVTQPLSQS